jgi:hypothetical protein
MDLVVKKRPKMDLLVKNGQKWTNWSKMAKNGPNGQKKAKNGPNGQKGGQKKGVAFPEGARHIKGTGGGFRGPSEIAATNS